MLRNGAVVLVISDGWDRGDLELLRDEMARLQKNSARLIWLNPLLGETALENHAQGLQVALPYVGDHLSVQNLASLEQLVAVLSTLHESRPERRQMPRGNDNAKKNGPDLTRHEQLCAADVGDKNSERCADVRAG